MAPGYGLAEHTVYVCGNGKQRLWLDKTALQNRRIQVCVTSGRVKLEVILVDVRWG